MGLFLLVGLNTYMIIDKTKTNTMPITLAEARTQCQVDGTAHDTQLTGLIEAITNIIEKETNIDTRSCTYELWLPRFPNERIRIPRGPLTAVSKIEYYSDGEKITLPTSQYRVYTPSSVLGYVQCVSSFPHTDHRRDDAVIVSFTSGYSTCPPAVKQAALLSIKAWFDSGADPTELKVSPLPLGFERLVNACNMGAI